MCVPASRRESILPNSDLELVMAVLRGSGEQWLTKSSAKRFVSKIAMNVLNDAWDVEFTSKRMHVLFR